MRISRSVKGKVWLYAVGTVILSALAGAAPASSERPQNAALVYYQACLAVHELEPAKPGDLYVGSSSLEASFCSQFGRQEIRLVAGLSGGDQTGHGRQPHVTV